MALLHQSGCSPGVLKAASALVALVEQQFLCCCTTDARSIIKLESKGKLWLLDYETFLSRGLDCAKHNPEVSEDMEKNFAELLSEELKLREAEALESQQRADMALLEAKKLASSYQKEADKCNSGMETCEEAREKAEATLLAQKRLTAMWELRARQRGWKEGSAKSHAASR
ncbi:hypothetical protein Scep_012819 [Stephania cephalantha]|uniref:Uncharacterized protein n=1 Tax=Stephania cephalantha TaxID=152367 RepID=A0AAP0JH31_9MAGN